MELRFQPHAVERMQERRISVAEIEAVISEPDGKIRQSRDKSIFYKNLKGRSDNLVAAVVIEFLPGGIIEVITVLVNFEVRK
jgi:hypothetical protein